MKIRCKNCYRILKPQEEYCTNCGYHSVEVEKYLKTGHYDISEGSNLKVALIVFFLSAVIGNGIYMIALGAIQNKITSSYKDLFCMSNSLLISSLVSLFIVLIIYRKELKTMFNGGTSKQKLASLVIGILVIIMCSLFTKISEVTQLLPTYLNKYLASPKASFFANGGDTSIFRIIITFIGIYITEEIIFRHRLIMALDEETMIGDLGIIIIASLAGTILDFAWIMSINTLILSLIVNITMTCIYIYNERNIALNIIIRVLLLLVILCI